MPDLDALNPAERETLALLAQGHTAKSIASLTGRSVASVNERLREARRKAGMGSSRELARLLAAQENQDEQMGVAPLPPAAPVPPPRSAPRRAGSASIGVLVMTIAAFIAAAMLLPGQQDAPAAADPLLRGLVQRPADTGEGYYRRLRAETRDQAWAPQAEARLRARFLAIPGVAADRLRVTCGATLCEVAGVLVAGDDAAMNKAYDAIQGPALRADMRALGFTGDGPMGFGGTSLTDSRFYAYWTRRP